MYGTSANYKTYIKKPSRIFDCEVVIGSRTFTNSDIIQIVPEIVQPSDGFSIGNTVSQSIDITLRNDGGVYASVGEIDVQIGLNTGSSFEYIPIGVFNIDSVTKTDYTVQLTCYDNMIKFETSYSSSLGDTPTLQQVVDELANITGVEFTGTLPSYTVTKLSGYTCREVLAYVASVCGGNAYITRDGKFTIVYAAEVDCTITADNYINTGYTIEDSTYTIGMVTCQNTTTSSSITSYDSSTDTNCISVGSLTSDTMELTFANPWVTASILNDIYNKLNGFSYLGYDLQWQGDLSLDAGDIITIIDDKNVTRTAYVFANTLTYTGGLVAETSSTGETKSYNSFSPSGSNSQDISRLSVQLLIAQEAIITKANISDLEANNAEIENLNASVATINTALIDCATIDQLNATNANIGTLNASVANIDSALINKANVADLTVTNATVANLNATVANIQSLVNGNLTSANIQSLILTSSKVTVDDGFITNAMIENLDVDKINAGTLNTNKISVSSSDGSLIIAGATQQFKDSSGYVRLQLGQDAEGNFDFILTASDGTTTLIDGTGVHANAIADKLIKTNMVADQAITNEQINYSSFATGFNASTNTNYINASHVQVDLTGQTLDISFSNLNTTVNGLETTTSSNTTSISAIQGQISTLISNTTITTGGTTTQLIDAYNGTVDTINSMQTTIGQHTSTLYTQSGEISSVSSQVTSIQADLDSIELSISSAQTTLTSNSSQLASLQLSVNGINTRVETTETSISNLQVGGRNYILASDFQDDIYTNYWTLTSLYDIETYTYNNYTYNSLICDNTSDIWSEIGQCIDSLTSNTTYTFSAMCYGEMTISICQIIYDPTLNSNNYIYSELDVSNTDYTKEILTFTTSANVRYGYLNIATPRDTTSKIALLKLEQGNVATDWSPAPEDTTQSITSAVSQINQTTDSITLSVSSLQSSVSSINNTTSLLQTSINGINASITTLNSNVTANDTNVSSLQSSISILQGQITLKVEQSNIDTAVTTINGQIASTNTTISSLQSQITIQAGQISSKVSSNDVGTIISQSPTQVMTAFNNITSYFQVNSSGATFGNTSSGDYTTVGSGGMQHHIGGANYDYMYIVYSQNVTMTIPSGSSSTNATFSFDSTLLTLLNGRIPKAVIITSVIDGGNSTYYGYQTFGKNTAAWCSGITTNTFILTGFASYTQINYLSPVNSGCLDWKNAQGGTTLEINVLILA